MGIFNNKLLRNCLIPSCVLITGDRGTGKSCIFALIVSAAKKQGLKVYSQYPYKGTYRLPMEEKVINGVKRPDVSKKFLYTHDFTDSVILLDEVKTIWNARSYTSWTADDEEFFNMIRKNNTRVYMATQSYDGVDLNIRRAVDETWFLTLGSIFKSFTHVEVSHTQLCKVADKNTEVVGRLYKQGMQKVVWDICEVPLYNALFYRKPFYNDYFTYFTYQKKAPIIAPEWEELISNFGDSDAIFKKNKK